MMSKQEKRENPAQHTDPDFGIELPPAILRAREKHREEEERLAQIPPDLEKTFAPLLRKKLYPTPLSEALQTVLDFALGEAELRRIHGECVAAAARNVEPDFIDVPGIPIDRVPFIRICKSDTHAYAIRNDLIGSGRGVDTPGIIDAMHWQEMRTAIRQHPNVVLFRLDWPGRIRRTWARDEKDKPHRVILYPGGNLLPATWLEGFVRRREVDEWRQQRILRHG